MDLNFLKVLPECAHWYVELAKKAIFVLTFSEGIFIGCRVFRGVTSQKLHTECSVKKLLRVSGCILLFFSMKEKSCHIQTSSLSCKLTVVASHG